jgi:hypothetical protein
MDMDIIGAASLDWSVTWWENADGNGNNWVEHVISGNFNYAFAVYAAYMDNDGDYDVLGASYFGDDITLWENTDGLGLTWYEHTIDGSFDGARDVATADMDGDGDLDVLGAAAEDADISWWDITCCTSAGELVSSILDTEMSADWDSITWAYYEPAGTSIYFQVRSSMDPQYMGSWSADITAPGNLDAYITDGDQYVQYKAFLETTNPGLTPILWDVTITWTELVGVAEDREQKPGIRFTAEPNPFREHITISLIGISENQNIRLPEIKIYDISGRMVKGLSLPTAYSVLPTEVKWDAKGIAAGVYFLSVDGIAKQKIIKIE